MPRTSSALLALLCFLPAPVRAQSSLGAMVAWHDGYDLGLGASAEVDLPSWHPSVSALFEGLIFFPEDGRGADLGYMEFNGGLLYRVDLAGGALSAFALGGVNLARFSFTQSIDDPTDLDFNVADTEIGLNLGGGVTFRGPALEPTVGARLEVEGGEGLVLFGALGLPVGE